VSELRYAEKTKIDIVEYHFVKRACHNVLFKQIQKATKCDQTVDVLWELQFIKL